MTYELLNFSLHEALKKINRFPRKVNFFVDYTQENRHKHFYSLTLNSSHFLIEQIHFMNVTCIKFWIKRKSSSLIAEDVGAMHVHVFDTRCCLCVRFLVPIYMLISVN